MLFGAATHDIGKTAHVAELSGPGSAHEEAGRRLLLARGVDAELARFAGTHATWADADNRIEDLLVSVADKIWKNKRVPELEDMVVRQLAEASGRTAWEEFLAFDDLLTTVGEGADGTGLPGFVSGGSTAPLTSLPRANPFTTAPLGATFRTSGGGSAPTLVDRNLPVCRSRPTHPQCIALHPHARICTART